MVLEQVKKRLDRIMHFSVFRSFIWNFTILNRLKADELVTST